MALLSTCPDTLGWAGNLLSALEFCLRHLFSNSAVRLSRHFGAGLPAAAAAMQLAAVTGYVESRGAGRGYLGRAWDPTASQFRVRTCLVWCGLWRSRDVRTSGS